MLCDHNMLVVECMVGRKSEVKVKEKKRKWKLRDANWENFQLCLSEKMWNIESVQDVDEVIENVRSAGVSEIGYVRMSEKKRKNKPWWNEEIKEARRLRKNLNRECRRLKKRRHESEEAEVEYQSAWAAYVRQQRLTKRKIRDAKVKCEKSTIQSLKEKGLQGGREWYRFMRGENITESEGVKDLKVNDRYVSDEEEMKEAVKMFWEDIGGVGEVFDARSECLTLDRKDAAALDEWISIDEVKKCVKRQKNGKAAGPDEIPYEMYKNGGETVIERMTDVFNRVWREEKVPKKWNECRVTLLHKGGHKSKKELRNYRPIALTDTVGKIFSAVLNERLCKWIERNRVLGEEQNGFRIGRRAEDNIFVLNEMIERKRSEGRKLYLGFLDIEKAYDRVSREMLCKVLEKVGLSEKIVNIVRSMYQNTRAKYRLGNIETEWVRSERGVRQGCILSPTLFSLYTEELAVRMRRINAGVKVGTDKLGLLLYADDVVVMSESANELQSLLDIVGQYGRDFGVRFSSEKSKVMIVNRSQELG